MLWGHLPLLGFHPTANERGAKGLSFLHNGIFIAVIAHGLIGTSLVWDKVLLRRPDTTNVLSYVFWLGCLSVLGVILVPFGFHPPSWTTMVLAFGTGVLHQIAICFYYFALREGEASQTLAIMGGFSPVATALIALGLLRHPLGGRGALVGFVLLVLGGFLMSFSEPIDPRKVLLSVVAASGLFGLVNVMQKLAFNRTNFVSGYVIFTLGTFAASLALLVRPQWRREIFETSEKARPKSRFWYFVNRFISGVGSFLVFYAISLTSPALVDGITGLRYVIIFVGAYWLTVWRPRWLREDFSGRVLAGKLLATALIVAGLVILGVQSHPRRQGLEESSRRVTTGARPRPPQPGPRPSSAGARPLP